jgi:hypothetical protein
MYIKRGGKVVWEEVEEEGLEEKIGGQGAYGGVRRGSAQARM